MNSNYHHDGPGVLAEIADAFFDGSARVRRRHHRHLWLAALAAFIAGVTLTRYVANYTPAEQPAVIETIYPTPPPASKPHRAKIKRSLARTEADADVQADAR